MKVYCFGDITCSGEVENVDVEFDINLIEQAYTLKDDDDYEAINDFFDQFGFDDRTGYGIDLIISDISKGELAKKLKEGFWVMGDEELFGIGLTKKDAQVQYGIGKVQG